MDTSLDEIIFVDDGSTDNSKTVANKYLGGFDRIVSTCSKRGNRARCRNIGAELATNEILLFLDADALPGRNALTIHRHSHIAEKGIAFSGITMAPEFDIGQFEVKFGISLNSILKDAKWLDKCYTQTDGFDWRYRIIKSGRKLKFPWVGFYSNIASVNRKAFYDAGGFDEEFVSWASEDIDLGYRLNKIGTIDILPNSVAVHVPHGRKRFENVWTNHKNEYLMLKKYEDRAVEYFVCYGAAVIYVYDIIESILKETADSLCSDKPRDLQPGTLKISIPDPKVQNSGLMGKLGNNTVFKKNFLGVAIPLADNTFDSVFISSEYLFLPEPLFAAVLQESCRVSKKVFIHNTHARSRWQTDILTELQRVPHWSVRFHASRSIKDFCFTLSNDNQLWQVRLDSFYCEHGKNSLFGFKL